MSAPDGVLELDPCFGRAARSLAPRGLHGPSTLGAAVMGSDEIAVAFRPDAGSATRELIDRLDRAGASIRSHASPRGVPETTLRCARPAWIEASAGSSEAAALLAANERTRAACGPIRIMGIVNVTPDSFSDGGRFLDRDRAVEHGLALAAEGADILDVGGESTRPGAAPVALDEELTRVVPVVETLARAVRCRISVDTTKSAVARAAIEAGASMVNDVSAGRFDPPLLALVAERGVDYVAMHMQGTPRDMQLDPQYDDVVADVLAFLRESARACLEAGIERARIAIDPGIGFGKTLEHNVELLRRLPELRSLGLPVCLGVSRKSFLARLSGEARADRAAETAAAVAIGVLAGAEILRVHDVAGMRAAAKIAEAFRK